MVINRLGSATGTLENKHTHTHQSTPCSNRPPPARHGKRPRTRELVCSHFGFLLLSLSLSLHRHAPTSPPPPFGSPSCDHFVLLLLLLLLLMADSWLFLSFCFLSSSSSSSSSSVQPALLASRPAPNFVTVSLLFFSFSLLPSSGRFPLPLLPRHLVQIFLSHPFIIHIIYCLHGNR